MRRVALLVVLAVVLAGCAAPSAPSTAPGSGGSAGTNASADGTATSTEQSTNGGTDTDGTNDGDTTTTSSDATPDDQDDADAPSDPADDRIGWEGGYWYNESVAIDAGDGLNDTEIDRVLARTMARVEVIRDLEFEQSVDVEVISREEYRERNVFEFDSNPWRDQVWEATFLVNETSDSGDALEAIYSGQVTGYYYDGSIVLVSDDPDAVRIDRGTLAHELTHALQAQHFEFRGGRSHDARLAALSLTEGDANYVMDRYQERCGTDWECIEGPANNGSVGPINRGLFVTVFVPYSDGPTLVGELRARGGWAAVNDAMDRRPDSTEQVIHPQKYPDDTPVDVSVADRSNGEWERFGSRPGGETVGEATLYAAFWYNGVIEEDHVRSDDRRYNYSHPVTAGWGGDAVVPYRSPTADGYEYGYVFETVWDTERDAREFRDAYVELLESNGAREVREGVYRIPEGEPYADAFRVERRGDTVVVVNAPAVADLPDVHEPQ